MGLFSRKSKQEPAPAPVPAYKKLTREEMIAAARRVKKETGRFSLADIQRTFQVGMSEAIKISQEIDGIKTYKVAGVTYKNDDKTNRQTLLRKYHFADPPFNGDTVEINLEPYEYEGQPAYYVTVNGYTMGTLEAAAAPEVHERYDEIEHLHLTVDSFKDDDNKSVYYARITVRYSV